VLNVPDALADEQLAGRGLIGTLAIGDELLSLSGSPIVADGTRPMAWTPPPELGADNLAVWSELGLTDQDIRALSDEGII
jgi:formyl-CoA transferase